MGRATVRISLKTIAMKFPPGSMQRVYLHGKWQKSRGRKPSMRYGNHKDFGTAYRMAEVAVGQYFDQIRKIPSSRGKYFWGERLIQDIIDSVPPDELKGYR
jgi:hypothetical protein